MSKTKKHDRKRKSLADLRAVFNPTERANTPTQSASDSPILKFWEMQTDTSIELRILPDKNAYNVKAFTLQQHKHSFKVGNDNHWFTCNKHQHSSECSACEASAAQYAIDTPESTKHGRNLYKNTKHIMQVLVLSYPLDPTVEGTIKNISVSPNLMKQIVAEFADLDHAPCDFDNGYKLKITKGKQGDFASYSARFVGQPTALTDEEYELYEKDGVDLATLLPAPADVATVESATKKYKENANI